MARAGNRTGLIVVVEGPADPAAGERLRAALAACSVASVLISSSQDHALETAPVRSLLAAAQGAGAAALLAGDARLARTLEADGVHLPWSEDLRARFDETRAIVGKDGIVGVDAGTSRHDAMVLAEAGADYVGFTAPADAGDIHAARDRLLGLVAWWAEVFEVPSVAFDVAEPEDARLLSEAGADFLAVRIRGAESAAHVAARLSAIEKALPQAKQGP